MHEPCKTSKRSHGIFSRLLLCLPMAWVLFACSEASVEHEVDDVIAMKPTEATPPPSSPMKVGSANLDATHQDPLSKDKRARLQYVLRLTHRSNPLTSADIETFRQIPAPLASRFDEAAYVVGALRWIIETAQEQQTQSAKIVDQTNTSQIVDQNQPTGDMPPATGSDTERSLSALMKLQNIDLSEALSQNVALKNHELYQLALDAISVSSDDENQKMALRDIIYGEANKWARLLSPPQPIDTPVTSTLDHEESLETNDLGNGQPAADQLLNPADLRRSDSLLVSANKLAEDGDFKKALEVIAQIQGSDPIFAVAQEKARKLSNQAVQQLRQKAAQAYQVALPLSDAKVRRNYLNEAKVLLESAMNDYPLSDQAEVIQQNLAVISKDLQNYGHEEGSVESDSKKSGADAP